MRCWHIFRTPGQLGRATVALLLVLHLLPLRHANALDPTPSAAPSDTPTPGSTPTPVPTLTPTPAAGTPTPTVAPTSSPVPTPIADPLCGTIVSGQLTLDHDVQGCRGAGFKLTSGALLDCNGHAIVGNGGSYGVLLNTAVGAEVRGCRITGFSRGVRVLGGNSNRVIANEPYTNRNYGIELAGASAGNRIEINFVHDNGDEGIHVGAGASGNEIFSNQIVRSALENLYLINCSGNFAMGNVLDAGGAAAIFVKHSSNNTFTDNDTTAGLVQIRGNSVGNVFQGSRLQGEGFRFEAYDEPGIGWTFPHANVVDGGSIQGADVCFSFVGAYDNHAAHVIVDRCTPVAASSLGGQDPVDNTADLCGDGIASGDEACDLAALNGAATTCCTATCAPRASAAICRVAASECDLPDTCTGASGACPSDTFKPGDSACTDDGKICSADICDGNGHCTHPPGNVGAICRPSSGPCDVADVCGGSSRNCGADKVQPAGTPCRAVAGACDVAEVCTGSSPSCPADTVRAAGVVCRAAAGACDVAESCDGASPLCPANAHLGDGSSCSDGNACTGPDTCKAGACVGANPVVCTPSDACHLSGTCDPHTGVCSNPAKPDGSSCDGVAACLSSHQCIAGACTTTSPAGCAPCEICDLTAGCVARPRDDCLVSPRTGTSRLALFDSATDQRDTLSWSWSIDHGAAQSDFGNPMLTTSYGLCVFSSSGGAPALLLRTQAPAGGSCGAGPCWRESNGGFRYANGDAIPDGTTVLQLSRSAAGAARLKLLGKGTNLLLPPLPLQPGLIVQLQSDDACWSAQMSNLRRNTSTRVYASSD